MPRVTDLRVRRGTASAWTSANPTLNAGEMGYETDTKKLKFGDGTLTWANLPYFALGTLTKSDVGLPNVDNTSDSNKPVSTLQRQALQQAEHAVGAGIDPTGVTDSSTALQAKLDAAATSAFGKAVYLPPGTYLADGLVMNSTHDGVKLYGWGADLKMPSGGSGAILTINGAAFNTRVEGLTFSGNQGSNTAASLSAPNGTQTGLLIQDDVEMCVVSKCLFRNFGSVGLQLSEIGYATGGARWDGASNKIENCQAENCYYGVAFETRAEYVTATDVSAVNCRFGMVIRGGNVMLANCQLNRNYLGLHVASSTNSGHGSATGCQFNHNTNIAIQIDEPANGFQFTGCQVFYGIVLFNACAGAMFNGCTFGTVTIRATGGGKNLLADCFILGGSTMTHNWNSVTSNTTLHNCYRADGTALT